MNAALIRETAMWAFWRLTMAAIILVALAGVASAQYCTPDQCDECDLNNCQLSCCHELPELWLVNTRCAPKCNNLDAGFERISVKRWDASCRRFVKSSWDELIAQEASMPTLVFAHGNTLQHDGAMKQCWDVYNKMRCCPGKKRLVFWSWPAQIDHLRPLLRPRQLILSNLRIKFVYAEYQGYYMAKLVQRMSMTQRVTVGGHSYGGIIGAVAAHLIGGGEIHGLSLAGAEAVERPNFRVALVSAAFDNDALDVGGRYGQAFVSAEKIYVTRNRIDSTLKRWPKISLRCKKAIGVTGVNANCLGENAHKLCQQTLTSDVGSSHYIEPHLGSRRFMNALCCVAFPACAECVKAEQAKAKAPAEVKPAAATTMPAANSEVEPKKAA
ncbi:MAG: hypothetical protein C0485_03455 [Pirellula sp.]|nr:hypothetical protein [Pirellula sp.]